MVVYRPSGNLPAPEKSWFLVSLEKIIRLLHFFFSPVKYSTERNVALTSLANKGKRCIAGCTEPFPIIPQGSAALRRSGQTGPVGIIGYPGIVTWRPLPGFHSVFPQADPDQRRDAAGRSDAGQSLHVIRSLDGSQVSVVVPAVLLGIVPRHALGYQEELFLNVGAQSDATCRGARSEH